MTTTFAEPVAVDLDGRTWTHGPFVDRKPLRYAVPVHDCARYQCDEGSYEHAPGISQDLGGEKYAEPITPRAFVSAAAYRTLRDEGMDGSLASAILTAAGL